MDKAVLYIHGKGGNAGEAEHYKKLFPDRDVVGFDYRAGNPWDAAEELRDFYDRFCMTYRSVSVIANSIGAYYAMCALNDRRVEKAYFISPIVDMEKLICDMMVWAAVSEDELREKGSIDTDFGERLSWEYLFWVREHPVLWEHPTYILYADGDGLQSYDTVSGFAERISAEITVMKGGEHWFHTDAQMAFLDAWLISRI